MSTFLEKNLQLQGLPVIGFNLADEGSFDTETKKMVSVANPEGENDVRTKIYTVYLVT